MPQASHLSSPSHKILCNEHSNARMLPFFPSAHSSTFRQRKTCLYFETFTWSILFICSKARGRIRETLKMNLNLEQLREFGPRNCVATDDLIRQLSCTVCFNVQKRNEKKKKRSWTCLQGDSMWAAIRSNYVEHLRSEVKYSSAYKMLSKLFASITSRPTEPNHQPTQPTKTWQ